MQCPGARDRRARHVGLATLLIENIVEEVERMRFQGKRDGTLGMVILLVAVAIALAAVVWYFFLAQ